MSRIDQFESAFRSAAKPVFELSKLTLSKAVLLTDLEGEALAAYQQKVQYFLAGLTHADTIEWVAVSKARAPTVGALLEVVQNEQPDFVCAYRNLHSSGWRWPYTLGDHVEVLTQVTDVPVLLLPRPDAETALDALEDTNRVMAITDHLTGDDLLVSYATRFTEPTGTVYLAHVEDDRVFERYLDVIGKIPEIDTDLAREKLRDQLLKEPRDFIASVATALSEAAPELTVEPLIEMGHHLSVFKALVSEHAIDLIVINTKDDAQLAMHGLAYPLAVELRDVPMLML